MQKFWHSRQLMMQMCYVCVPVMIFNSSTVHSQSSGFATVVQTVGSSQCDGLLAMCIAVSLT